MKEYNKKSETRDNSIESSCTSFNRSKGDHESFNKILKNSGRVNRNHSRNIRGHNSNSRLITRCNEDSMILDKINRKDNKIKLNLSKEILNEEIESPNKIIIPNSQVSSISEIMDNCDRLENLRLCSND